MILLIAVLSRVRSQRQARGRRIEADLRRLVYSLIAVDRDGWRRWRGSPDAKGYPRVPLYLP